VHGEQRVGAGCEGYAHPGAVDVKVDTGGDSMTKKTVVAIAVIVALLFGAVTPSRARASVSTPVLVIGSIVAFVAFVTVGTLLTTNREVPLFLQQMPPEDPDATVRMQQHTVRFGTQCQPTSNGDRPLACW
jgi:hypothetical protein